MNRCTQLANRSKSIFAGSACGRPKWTCRTARGCVTFARISTAYPCSARWCAAWQSRSTIRASRLPRPKCGRRSRPRPRNGIDNEASTRINQAAKQLNQKVLGPMDALLLDPTLIAAEDDTATIRHASPAGGHGPIGQPHAASASPVRQPCQRADPRNGDQQRDPAVGTGRPDVHTCRNSASTLPRD